MADAACAAHGGGIGVVSLKKAFYLCDKPLAPVGKKRILERGQTSLFTLCRIGLRIQ